MAESSIVSVRFSQEFLKTAKSRAKAKGLEIGPYIRSLIAADLGIEPPDMPTGLRGASESDRRKVAKAGVKSRWKKSEK